MTMTRRSFLIASAAATGRPLLADAAFPGHKVAGNLYYCGSHDFSSYLITSPRGHVLINSSFDETVPLIKAAVEELGFKFSDIRILLTSHAHADHCAGNALVREITGCQVLVMRGDEEIVRSGGQGDFHYNSRFRPCPVDRVLADNDKVELGGASLTARHTPGHTRGCTTWTMTVNEGGRDRPAVIIGSPNVNRGYKLVNNAKYPEIAADFAKTFRLLKSLPCDLFLGAHGNYYGLDEKYPRLKANPARNPFLDPEGYRTYIESKQKAYREELARQQAA